MAIKFDKILGKLREVDAGGSSGSGTGWDGEIDNYAGLPLASTVPNEVYKVLNTQGTWVLGTKKKAGLYESDGIDWKFLGVELAIATEAEIDDGTESAVRRISPALMKRSVEQHSGSLSVSMQKVYVDHVNGTSGGNGAITSPLDTIANAVIWIESPTGGNDASHLLNWQIVLAPCTTYENVSLPDRVSMIGSGRVSILGGLVTISSSCVLENLNFRRNHPLTAGCVNITGSYTHVKECFFTGNCNGNEHHLIHSDTATVVTDCIFEPNVESSSAEVFCFVQDGASTSVLRDLFILEDPTHSGVLFAGKCAWTGRIQVGNITSNINKTFIELFDAGNGTIELIDKPNAIDLYTNQTITGEKTFTDSIKMTGEYSTGFMGCGYDTGKIFEFNNDHTYSGVSHDLISIYNGGSAGQIFWGNSRPRDFSIASDGIMYIYDGGYGRRLYAIDTSDWSIVETFNGGSPYYIDVAPIESGGESLEYNEDNGYLYFGGRDCIVHVIDPTNGSVVDTKDLTTQFTDPNSMISSMRHSSDGNWYLIDSFLDYFHVYDSDFVHSYSKSTVHTVSRGINCYALMEIPTGWYTFDIGNDSIDEYDTNLDFVATYDYTSIMTALGEDFLAGLDVLPDATSTVTTTITYNALNNTVTFTNLAIGTSFTIDGETITALATGTADNDTLATKGYVDDNSGGGGTLTLIEEIEHGIASNILNLVYNYTGSELTSIDYNDTSGGTTLYTAGFNYNSGVLTDVVYTRMSDGTTSTKTMTYTSGILTEINWT